MRRAPIKSTRQTSKRYTVAFCCCDPPVPIELWNTDSPIRARWLFNTLKRAEEEAIRETGALGGEWTLSLWEHTPLSRLRVFTADDPRYGGRFVHSIIYEGSRTLDTTSYMDYLRHS